MRRLAAALAICALSFAATGCAKGAEEPPVALDGSPRYPDDEGVVTALTFEQLTLDGTRTYAVSKKLLSFSTYDREIEPMLNRRSQYVQVGLQKEGGRDAVVWMAGIAAVVRTEPPAVYYTGEFLRVDDRRRAAFRDGTVLTVAEDVTAPAPGTRVAAKIDPGRHLVTTLNPQ